MRSHRTRRFLSRNQFRRTTAITGLTGILMVSGVAYAGLATADVSADDSRATVVQGNINACPAGQATLVDGGTSTTTQNGITVTVSHLATSQPNPFPAGGVTTLPAGTAVLNITLPAGTTLSGDTYVKGADGYNDYPGQYTVNLIPPVSNGGQIAGLSHFFVCGTLVQTTGSINVKKVVDGSGPGSNGTFKVEVDCGAIDQTLTLSDGQDLTVDNIPDGSSCTVTETDNGGSDSTSYTVNGGAPGGSAPTFTVHAGDSDHVVVTNTYAPGSLKVTKTVVDHGTAPDPATTYPVTVSCPGQAGTPFTFSLTDGQSHTISPLDDGAQCTVTETNSHGGVATYTVDAGAPGSTPPTVGITHGAESDVTITNTFPAAPPATGSVSVTKNVTGVAPVPAPGPFSFSLDCGGVTTTFDVAAGNTHTENGVPAGNCTLTETDSQGASSTTYAVNGGTPGATANFTVTAGQTTPVVVDNHYNAAELDVTKLVTGAAAPTGPFGVTVDCGGANVFTFTLNANDVHAVTGLPGGSQCTVTETDPDGATTTTYTVGAGSPSSTAPTVNLGVGDTKNVTITNDFAGATLQVTKVTTGTSPATGPFHVDVECTTAGSFQFDINAGQTHQISGLGNDTCTVTETDNDGATSTTYTVNAGAADSNPPSVPVSRGNTDTVTITNNYPVVAAVGSLTVNKVVGGLGAGHEGPFTVTADCGTDGTFVFSGLVDGSSQTQQVPAGATCTVTETDANGASDIGYAIGSGAPSSTAPSVDIVSGQTTTVTVINSFPVTSPGSGGLHIHKTVDKTKARYGQNLTYTLRVRSIGLSDEHNVTVNDVVPAHTTFVSASCDAPCTTSGPTSGGVVTWHIGTIPAGQSVTVTMVVNITTPPEAPGARQPETIPNVGLGASNEVPSVKSNKVHTRVTVVQGGTVHRHRHQTTGGSTLPFTGYNARAWGLAAIMLIGIGAGLSIVARRRSRLVPVTKSTYPTSFNRHHGRHER